MPQSLELRWVQINFTQDGLLVRANLAGESAIDGGIDARDVTLDEEDLGALSKQIEALAAAVESHLGTKRAATVTRTAVVERPAPPSAPAGPTLSRQG